jgi:hypothetical protein
MQRRLDRRRLLALGATGAAATIVTIAERAPGARAETYGVAEDVARLRTMAIVELLELAYIERAIEHEELLHRPEARALRTMRLCEQDHYRTIAAVLGPEETPTEDDHDFGFPGGSFSSRKRILQTGVTLERMATQVAIGAAIDLERPDLRGLAAQLASVESTHEAGLRHAAGLPTPQRIMPRPLDAQRGNAALSTYLVG